MWRLTDILPAVQVHPVDLRDREAVDRAIAAIRPHVIYHLAAHGAYSTQQDQQKIFATNIDGTVNLVAACARSGFRMMVNIGSSSEYGPKPGPIREDASLEPNSYYAVAKAAATHYCRHVALSRGLPIITLRPFHVYGPWEEPSRLVPTLALALLDGKLPPLVASATARDFVYVDDMVDACLLAAARPDRSGEVLNIWTGTQSTLRDVVDISLTLSGVRAVPDWGSMPPRSWDTTAWVADPGRATSLLNFTARHDLRSGLARTLSWFDDHRSLYRPVAALPT